MTKEIEIEGFGAFADAIEGIYNRPAIPATTGATAGDVLTLGSDGPEWATPAGGNDYSTDERAVGKWIDGSTVYEKTLIMQSAVNLSAGAWANSGCQISGIGIIPQATVIRSDSYGPWAISVGYNKTTGDIQLFSSAAASLGANSMIIIRYTKTTV